MLLSAGSAKIDKSNKFSEEFLSKILYLAPHKISGYQTCPSASAGCAAACLYTAGMGVYTNVQQARVNKTKRFFEDRPNFMRELSWEIRCAERLAIKLGKKLVVRLNGTSDLPWEKLGGFNQPSIMEQFPDVIFYDYTKIHSRMLQFVRGELAPNYHLTFSLSENNLEKCLDILNRGGNVAAVFQYEGKKADRKFPSQWLGYRVVDGDLHDLRFLDGNDNLFNNSRGLIVGLWAKGKAKKDTLDFAIGV